ncbi:MAG: hypothetical protein IT177_00625 [Acidobacteria bacterium]|nr:hypothetical protein [Acidobacteriota bacterium]
MRRAAALLVAFVAMAVLHTWPLASDLGGLSRLDNDDTGLNTWIIAWVAHILPRDPLNLFNAPIFHPEPLTLAYSEHLLVPSLMGAPLLWAGLSPVVAYNLLALAGLAFSGWAMSLVMIRWTGSVTAGFVSGLLYTFNAHQLTRIPHLQALHIEFFPLALYAMDNVLTEVRSTGVRSTEVRSTEVQGTEVSSPSAPSAPSAAPASSASSASSALWLASAFVLQGLCSNYTLVFLSAALLVAAMVRMPEWLGPGRGPRASALALAGVLAVTAMAPFLWPYYLVSRDQGLVRSVEEVRIYSAGWLDYLATGGRLHYDWWSHRVFEGRTALFPGVMGVLLALAGMASSPGLRSPRVRMIAAIGVTGCALSFGPALPGYSWLHEQVPLLQGVRNASRWGGLFLAAIAMLAGYGVAALERRIGRSPYRAAGAAGLAGLVTLEALRTPMALSPVIPIPAIYDRLGADAGSVLVEFPMYAGPRVSENARYLVAATRHFRPLVNGYSGFEPEPYRTRAARWRTFPSDDVLDEMQAVGVSHVMLHLGDLAPEQVRAAALSPRLVLLDDDGDRRLYRVSR